jgi:F-type H+-transporting ATPase subunit b
MILIRHSLRSKFWCVIALLALLMSVTRTVPARAHESSAANSQAFVSEMQSTNAELAKEEEKDQAAKFKHSDPVKFIAKITGLSLENAYWLCVVVNFAIILGVIFWASREKLPAAFRGRTASIQKAMAEARAASEDANRRLADIESRLARLDGEIGEMRRAAEKEAAAEEERIKAAIADDVRKVAEAAEQEIAAAVKAARRDLQAYSANLVVSLAEKKIKVDQATDQSLVSNFAQRLASDIHSRRDGN